MSPFVKYSLARFGLFVAAFAVVWPATFWWLDLGATTIWAQLLLALMISAVASIFLLRGLREDVTRGIQHRADKMHERLEESRRAEDLD